MRCDLVCVVAVMLIGMVWAGAASAAELNFPPVAELPIQNELPDPLKFFDGSPVKTKEDWTARRAPELKQLFGWYMYGFAPPPPKTFGSTVVDLDENYFGGKAIKKQIKIYFGPKSAPKLSVLMILPKMSRPVPVFLGLNFRGNHTVVNDPKVQPPEHFESLYKLKNVPAGSQVDVWNAELIVDRGYGLVTLWSGDIDPDKNDFSDGVHAAYAKPGEPRGKHDWATIRAWAWGLSRVIDELEANEELIDAKRIAVVGHSRLGKTALLAAAMDDRIALAIPSQAGCGGTAPSRGKTGESVKQINDGFPHWFCDEFKEFNGQPERLPFDQHELAALCAPRPVLFSNAVQDAWANPAGQFEVLKAASKVYEFLGVEGLAADSMPEPNKLIDSRLGYFIRPGKHSMSRTDWQAWLDYADKWLK